MIEAAFAAVPAVSGAPDATLFSDYPVTASRYDEMCAAPGVLRPHWRDLARFLEETGSEELERRHAEVQRLLQADGVTYNSFGGSCGAPRRWRVDAVPLLMTGEDWIALAAGLEQRSRLLNALLADPGQIDAILARGAEKARDRAEPTLSAAMDAMGFWRGTK